MSKAKTVEHGLPKRIYTRWEENGTDDAWLSTAQNESDLADPDEHFVGVYELKEVHVVKTVTSTRIVSKAMKP